MSTTVISASIRNKVDRCCKNFLRRKGEFTCKSLYFEGKHFMRVRLGTCFREFTDVNEIEIDALGNEICTTCKLKIRRAERVSDIAHEFDFELAA